MSNLSSLRSSLLAASLITFGLVGGAVADDTDTLEVSASVSASCTITGNTLAFGAYDTVSGTQVDSSATLAVACTAGTETTVTLGEGSFADGASTAAAPLRQMSDGGSERLAYALFSDTLRTAVWGNTIGTGAPYVAASAAPQNLTVYGRITASQDVPAGSYTDSVVATIAF